MPVKGNTPTSCLLLACSIFCSPHLYAASPDFQEFLFGICAFAQPGSELDIRCNVDSENGDLSGDSEDSLNPTQSLSNIAGSLAETRSRIKALQSRLKQQREKNKKSLATSETPANVMDTFQMEGVSILLNGESGELQHELTLLEREYETDSLKFQIGADYRLADDWITGVLISFERTDTDFAADLAGNNFLPGNSEGNSEGDSISVNLFTTKNFGQSFYLDALFSYSWSDYTFSRIGLFQESSRTLPTIEVITSADTSGNQLAAGIGGGWDHAIGAHNYQLYGRINYQRSEIDGYSEQGGAGFAMRINDKSDNETVMTIGAKYAYSLNTQFGVVVPQVYVEYESLSSSDRQSTSSRFLADTSNSLFTVTGDKVDDAYGRIGASLVAVFPNGWTGFVSFSEVFSKDLFDQSQFNLGLRVEF